MARETEERLIRALEFLKEPQGSTISTIVKAINGDGPQVSLKKIVQTLRGCLENGILRVSDGRVKLNQMSPEMRGSKTGSARSVNPTYGSRQSGLRVACSHQCWRGRTSRLCKQEPTLPMIFTAEGENGAAPPPEGQCPECPACPECKKKKKKPKCPKPKPKCPKPKPKCPKPKPKCPKPKPKCPKPKPKCPKPKPKCPKKKKPQKKCAKKVKISPYCKMKKNNRFYV